MIMLFICIFIATCCASPTILQNTALLDTSTTNHNGANVTILNPNMVTVDSNTNAWDIDIISKAGWQMMVDLDANSWGFHPNKISTLQFELDSNTICPCNDKDLILSFSVGATQYITNMIEIDNSKNNWIYPGFDQSNLPTIKLGAGDVLSSVNADNNNDRICKSSNNVCNTCCSGLPTMNQRPYNNEFPLIWKLQNDPVHDMVYFEFWSRSWSSSAIQKCGFGESFNTNQGMQIYIGLDDNYETIQITSFNITYTITESNASSPLLTTATPIVYTTDNPSFIPTNNSLLTLTDNPSFAPTNNPSFTPTNNPSLTPTNNVSFIPTNNPLSTPTDTPTFTPTNNPSLNPVTNTATFPATSIKPTITTTIKPTNNPSNILTTAVPTEDFKDGRIEEETTQISIVMEEEIELKSSNDMLLPIIIGIMSICILCCVLSGVYLYIKRKKSKYDNDEDEEIRDIRLDTISHTFSNLNTFQTATSNKAYTYNVTNSASPSPLPTGDPQHRFPVNSMSFSKPEYFNNTLNTLEFNDYAQNKIPPSSPARTDAKSVVSHLSDYDVGMISIPTLNNVATGENQHIEYQTKGNDLKGNEEYNTNIKDDEFIIENEEDDDIIYNGNTPGINTMEININFNIPPPPLPPVANNNSMTPQ